MLIRFLKVLVGLVIGFVAGFTLGSRRGAGAESTEAANTNGRSRR